MSRIAFSLLGAFPLLCALLASAGAQPVVGPIRPGFGTSVSASTVTGEVDAAIYGQTPDGTCGGFVGTMPSHRLSLESDFADMVVRVDSYGVPASLVVYGPNGRRCSGPAMASPELAGPWPAGRYILFVGAQTQYGWVSYDLLVAETAADLERLATERLGAMPVYDEEGSLEEGYVEGEYGGLFGSTVGEAEGFGSLELTGPSPEAEGGFGVGMIGTGPEPTAPPADPTIAAADRPVVRETIAIDPSAITALVYDGSVAQETAAADLAPPASGACLGQVGINPDFAIQVNAATASLLLELDAPTGPALVRFGPVGSPSAAWTCTSSTGTPARLGGDWAPGRYLIWLGTTGGPGSYLFTVASAP